MLCIRRSYTVFPSSLTPGSISVYTSMSKTHTHNTNSSRACFSFPIAWNLTSGRKSTHIHFVRQSIPTAFLYFELSLYLLLTIIIKSRLLINIVIVSNSSTCCLAMWMTYANQTHSFMLIIDAGVLNRNIQFGFWIQCYSKLRSNVTVSNGPFSSIQKSCHPEALKCYSSNENVFLFFVLNGIHDW